MKIIKRYSGGILLAAVLAVVANTISSFVPYGLISGGVFALLLGMILNPFSSKQQYLTPGIKLVSQKVL
ncbi:MAG: putative sulfate exporter family transporter, partial [Clostridia bacterium]